MADDPTSTSDETPESMSDAPASRDPDIAAADQAQASGAQEGEPDSGTADPYATPADPHEGAVPPGYDWPTHGGYLGCLLGSTAACAISGFLGGTWFAILAAPGWVRLTITLVVAVAVFAGLGRLGWVLGKRFYREYPQPARGVAAAPLTGDTTRAGESLRD